MHKRRGVLYRNFYANYPLMLAEDLTYGEHTIHIRWNYQGILDYNTDLTEYNSAVATYNAATGES